MHASLKHALPEWRLQNLYQHPTDFVFSSERLKGSKPLDLASVLKKSIQPAFKKIGIKEWAGIHFGTRWEPCSQKWANTNS